MLRTYKKKSYLNSQALLGDGYCYPSASDRAIKACGVLEVVEPHAASKWQSQNVNPELSDTNTLSSQGDYYLDLSVYAYVCGSNAPRFSTGQIFTEDLQSQTPCTGCLVGAAMIKAQSLTEHNSVC